MVESGAFGDVGGFRALLDSLAPGNDVFLVSYDFAAYLDAQKRVDVAFKDVERWTRMSMLNCAGMGQFSSDRSIREYAAKIWHATPCRRVAASPLQTSTPPDIKTLGDMSKHICTHRYDDDNNNAK